MKYQRGIGLSDLFAMAAILAIVMFLTLRPSSPEIRDGVLSVDKINCPSVVPGEDTVSHCILSVSTKEPGRLTATKHILLLKEGEEFTSDEESE